MISFQRLDYPKINFDMTQDQKDHAIKERLYWIDNCEENLRPEQKAVLKAALEFAKEAFIPNSVANKVALKKSADPSRYDDFNHVFEVVLKLKDEPTEAFLLHMEAEVKIMCNKSGLGRLPAKLKEVVHDELLKVVSKKVDDQHSEIYKGMIGMRDGIRMVGGVAAGIVLWNAEYPLGISLAVATAAIDLYMRNRYKDSSANFSAWIVYQHQAIRQQMVRVYNATPTNWPSLFPSVFAHVGLGSEKTPALANSGSGYSPGRKLD